MDYRPEPLDTSDVVIPDEISEIIDMLAKNVHEVWAANRMREGWKYGEVRDERLKTHPCLVPYESLTESERYYDLCTSLETLKVILKLGFKIEKSNIKNP